MPPSVPLEEVSGAISSPPTWIYDRFTGKLVGSIGDNGRMAGYFHWIDAIAMDSKGNLYTGEVETRKRIQKFILVNGDGKQRFHPQE
jgi:subtilase family serine protease